MLLALLTLFGLGMYHGVGPDHCLAIGALSAGGGMRRALGVSIRFGVSHSLVLALCALAATVVGVAVPARWESALEIVGGTALFALGVWTVFSARALIPHLHEHTHEHAHGHPHAHDHTHSSHVPEGSHAVGIASLVGALFSLSGVRGLLLLLPLVMRQRPGLALAGVSAFGLGVMSSMIAFGWLTQRVAMRTASVERGLRLGVGVASMVLGSYWVFDHLA